MFNRKSDLKMKEMEEIIKRLHSDNQRLLLENQGLFNEVSTLNDRLSAPEPSTKNSVCDAWILGTELVANVRETLADSAEKLDREKQTLHESLNIFDETRQAVGIILDRVQLIQQKAQSGNGNVKNLITVSEQIEKFVGVIRDISDQTNLLALNAAIEAARAGESGRGFAVVADEVRNLARKASEASNEIAILVEQISSQTIIASDDIGQVDLLSSEVVSSAEQIRTGVSEAVDLSSHMGDVISLSAADAFIETVKLDHINWKNSVYMAIVTSDFNSTNCLADHTSCRLGNWYYMGEGQKNYSTLSSFAMLEAPHEQVHMSGLAAVQSAQSGLLSEASKHLSDMERASIEVANCLDKLNTELHEKSSG